MGSVNINILGLLIALPCLARGATYQYPVATFADNNHVLVITDQNQTLELSLYDCTTQNAEKVLSSSYLPAGVQLLPDESGFSFVDDGILCIKRFDRRSVHMVEPADPLYDIEYVHWLDNERCYFHAKNAGHNGIYMMNTEGEVTPLLVGGDTIEYLYPHIIDETLFCIERELYDNKIIEYSIVSGPADNRHKIISIGTFPLALLHMISLHEGFVLEYPAMRDADASQFLFTCRHFFKIDGQWKSERLFTFSVPSSLLFDPQKRLYESIVPVMPSYALSSIYYCSCTAENNKLNIYKFSLKTKKSELVTQESCSLLAPHLINNMLVCGSAIMNKDDNGIKILHISDDGC